jgi:N6-adenosine-specific RNA methylase IME4
MQRLLAHPLADLFPLIEGDDFSALVEDIRQHGVIDRIELLDGQILDGRNRYNALVHLVESGEVLGEGWSHRAGEPLSAEGLEPDNQWFRKFNRHVDGDPLPWVLSKNLKRRHLDESQRAMVAARIANMGVGRPKAEFEPAPAHIPPIGGISAKATAAMLNVGSRSVERARTVLKEGAPELQHAVEQGKVAVSTAETIASLPQAEQAEIVARGEREVLAAAKEIRSRQRRDRFEQVNQKLAAISEGSKPLPTGQRYPIIYADPATRYVSGFGDRSIENHYPTMTTEELCAFPVGELAMKDAVLFIWSTVPQLANTMKIIEAWGFKYVSEWCWDKVDQGTGHWGFSAHEPLLIATRGDFPAPVPGTQPRSLYREKKGDHSEKPAWFAEQIERIWPALPKIELFCRTPRAGWSVWGNQADTSADGVVSSLPAGESELVVTQASTSAETAEDGGSVTPSSVIEIPGEGASGTARKAPSAGSGDVDMQSTSGTQSAPPQPVDDMLEIPAFLRRRSGNRFSELIEASHETA